MEIKNHAGPPAPIMLRVLSTDTNFAPDQLFWIERKDNTNSYWDEEIRTVTNVWWFPRTPSWVSNSFFRAKPVPPDP